MPRTQPTTAELWVMLAAGALATDNGMRNSTTAEGKCVKAAREADLMLLQFHERFEWHDGWRVKSKEAPAK